MEVCGKIFRSRKSRQKHIKRKHFTKGEGLFDEIRIFPQFIFYLLGRKLVQFLFGGNCRERARGFISRGKGDFKACILNAETVSARGRGALFVLFWQFCSDLLC